MNILLTIKKIRKLLGISQAKMISGMTKSTYSKIERGEIDLKYNILIQICDTLGMSVQELLFFEQQQDHLDFKNKLEYCIKNNNNEKEKIIFLNKYYFSNLKNLELMSTLEIVYFTSIKTIFHGKWSEIEIYTPQEIAFLAKYLSGKKFYVENDYRILMNTIMFFNTIELKLVLNAMYPISESSKRTSQLINRATRALINLVSTQIFRLEYKEAMKTIDFINKTINFENDYFLTLSLGFHKNLALRFIERDTLYIEKAREIIAIIKLVAGEEIANTYSIELNNLTEKADYYLDEMVSNYPRNPMTL